MVGWKSRKAKEQKIGVGDSCWPWDSFVKQPGIGQDQQDAQDMAVGDRPILSILLILSENNAQPVGGSAEKQKS